LEYRPECYRQLLKYLGRSDASAEWIEVAVRHLRQEHAVGGETRALELAKTYSMHVRDLDLARLSARLGSLHILATYSNLEAFLDDFRSHHPRKVRSRTSSEDLVSYSLDAYGVSPSQAGTFECDVLEHYRRVRNACLHDPNSIENKRDTTFREKLAERSKTTRYARLAAPNGPTDLNFDDFALLTRSLKHFSRAFCQAAAPSDDELLELVRASPFPKRLRGLGSDRQVIERLATFLRSKFGLPTTASLVADRLVKNGLLAQG
jgi:hypothetical protein